MPDRIIRDEILESERMLGLKRNTHRLAFLALVLRADALGNLEASDGQLWRIWRDWCALQERSSVLEIVTALADADLIRIYQSDDKRFIHIPRTKQRLRWIKRICPISPWTTEKEKQLLDENTPGDRPAQAGASRARALEVKRREEKRSSDAENNSPAAVDKSPTSNPIDKELGKTNPMRPDETLAEYADRLKTLKPMP